MDPNIALAAGALLVTGLVLIVPVARNRRTERDDLEQDLRILQALPDDAKGDLASAIRKRADALAHRSLRRRNPDLIVTGMSLAFSGSAFVLTATQGDESAVNAVGGTLGVVVLVMGLATLVGGLVKR